MVSEKATTTTHLGWIGCVTGDKFPVGGADEEIKTPPPPLISTSTSAGVNKKKMQHAAALMAEPTPTSCAILRRSWVYWLKSWARQPKIQLCQNPEVLLCEAELISSPLISPSVSLKERCAFVRRDVYPEIQVSCRWSQKPRRFGCGIQFPNSTNAFKSW